MPVVQSRITYPNGQPAPLVRVDIRIIASPPWHADRTGATLGTSSVWTGPDGRWESTIEPYTRFEDPDSVYVEVVERGPRSDCGRWFLRVPDLPGPLNMRDLLINPPDPPDPGGWRPVITLADLLNVERAADTPQPGQTLVAGPDSLWTAGAPGTATLSGLADVDLDSVTAARPGDHLVLLGHGRWGVPTLDATVGLDPHDPTRTTAVVVLRRALAAKPVRVDWGAGADPVPVAEGQTLTHVYPQPGSYTVSVAYTDRSQHIQQTITVEPPAPPGQFPRSAPFVDAMGWPTPRLRKWFTQWGVQGFFLGFWVPELDADGWHLTWGHHHAFDRYEPLPDTECRAGAGMLHPGRVTDSGYLRWLARDIQGSGGVIIPSVGGAHGHPLEQRPEVAVADAAGEYVAALDNYATRFINFDIERGALGTADLQAKHVQVLAEIRRLRPDIRISHTLQVDIDGYTPNTRDLLAAMAAGGYVPDMLVGLLMDMQVAASGSYYDSLTAGAESVAAHHGQVFGWSDTESWARLGLCPMFGANHGAAADPRKVTTVDDMRRLVEFARERGAGMVSGWSANRDYNSVNPDAACEDTPSCPPGPPFPSIFQCTHVPQQHAEFCTIAATYTGPAGQEGASGVV